MAATEGPFKVGGLCIACKEHDGPTFARLASNVKTSD